MRITGWFPDSRNSVTISQQAALPHLEKLQRALLFPSEATEEAGEGVGNRDKSLTSQHEKTQYIKLKTDESRKSSLSMLFTNMEADTRIKALPWWRWGGYPHRRTAIFCFAPFGLSWQSLIWACITLIKINIQSEHP